MATREARNLEKAFDLAETGIDIMRMNLRRRHPDESDARIDERLRDWLARRDPDGPGRPRTITAA